MDTLARLEFAPSKTVKRRTTRYFIVLAVLSAAGFATADDRVMDAPHHTDAAPAARLPETVKAAAPKTAEASPIRNRRPTAWLPSHGRECQGGFPYRPFCNGPRRVPRPEGAAAQVSERLGLGTRQTATVVLGRAMPAEWLDAAPQAAADSLLMPIEHGRVGRGVGHTRHNHPGVPHLGVDITAPVGTPIRAATDGLVVYADNGVSGYGNVVMIAHADGSSTMYAHCSEAWVFPGQQVQRGQTIGLVGVTGRSRGAHLHFEYRRNGHVSNPVPRFARGRRG